MAKTGCVWGIDIGQCALKALRCRRHEDDENKLSAEAFDYIEYPKILSQPEADPVELVREASRRSGAVVLLKGPDTVVAAPDGRAVINVHAPPSLATAGSGDVLAGIAAGLVTQGATPLAAGAAAAWLHGESAYRFRHPGLIAEDLLNGLPEALESAMN